MKRHYISEGYNLKWQHKTLPYYVFTECHTMINLRTNRKIKQTLNGGYSKGYWIGKTFITSLKDYFEPYKREIIPF